MSILLLFLAAAQMGAQVGDWRHIMTASDGTITLIDGASISTIIVNRYLASRRSRGR